MTKRIQIEPVKNREHFLNMPFLTKKEAEAAMDRVVRQTELNMDYFGTRFPWPAAKKGTYEIIDNIEGTDGGNTGSLLQR